MLKGREDPVKAPDIMDLLIARERHPSGRDVWREAQPRIAGEAERKAFIALGWTEESTHQEEFKLLSRARALAFSQLPEDEQEVWNAKASEWKPTEPSK